MGNVNAKEAGGSGTRSRSGSLTSALSEPRAGRSDRASSPASMSSSSGLRRKLAGKSRSSTLGEYSASALLMQSASSAGSPATGSSFKKKDKSPDNLILVLDRSEMVDGGFLAPHGIYSGLQTFKGRVVRQLVLERRLAPFYKGLNDLDTSWTDRQLVAAVRGLPIPEEQAQSTVADVKLYAHGNGSKVSTQSSGHSKDTALSETSADTPMSLDSFDKDVVSPASPLFDQFDPEDSKQRPSPVENPQVTVTKPDTEPTGNDKSDGSDQQSQATAAGGSEQPGPFLAPSAQILSSSAPTSTEPSSRDNGSFVDTSSPDWTSEHDGDSLQQILDIKQQAEHIEVSSETLDNAAAPARGRSQTLFGASADPPLEVLLYREAVECPICFLYYPLYLNRTRCCKQLICTECFVQIKRADPHLPDHHQENPPERPSEAEGPQLLISEPATCPFCTSPDFAVTYQPPTFRTGMMPGSSTVAKTSSTTALRSLFHRDRDHRDRDHRDALAQALAPGSAGTSLLSTPASSVPPSPRLDGRDKPLSGNVPELSAITADDIRPDWQAQLVAARQRVARRSAAANALHATAFMLSPDGTSETGSHSNKKKDKGKKDRFRKDRRVRTNAFAIAAAHAAEAELSRTRSPSDQSARGSSSSSPGPTADAASSEPVATARSRRLQGIEDLMLYEAIRLSLAEEDDARRV